MRDNKIKMGAVAAITAFSALAFTRVLSLYPDAYYNLGLTLVYLLLNSVILYGIACLANRELFGKGPIENAPLMNFYELLISFAILQIIVVGGSLVLILEGEIEVIIDIAVTSMHYLTWTLVTLIKLLASKPTKVAAGVVTFLMFGFICLLGLAFAAVMYGQF